MCIGKAFIIVRSKSHPQYDMESNDHQPIVEKLKLEDNRPAILRNFIRIEMLPLGSLTSISPENWSYKIDEPGELPSWFEDKAQDWAAKCMDLMRRVIIPSWISDGVGGSLDLQGTQVSDLGQLTSVGGYLDLHGTQVSSVPNHLRHKVIF